jgi:hypothetical protein
LRPCNISVTPGRFLTGVQGLNLDSRFRGNDNRCVRPAVGLPCYLPAFTPGFNWYSRSEPCGSWHEVHTSPCEGGMASWQT